MLSGKISLITGSTSGIGLGIARALAQRGSNIILNGFGDANEISKICGNLSNENKVKVSFIGADLSLPDEIELMMASIKHDHGGVDILVNNAGIQHVSPIETFPKDKFDKIISLNLSAVFHTTRLALPHMKQKNFGRIINIASVHGIVGSCDKSAYVASKHGVIGLTKTVALETACTGVTVNAICPGWVLTPLVHKQIQDKASAALISYEEAKEKLLKEKQPSGEFVTPEQLGALTAFLCSDDAAQVRGVAWAMDGGWTAQ